MTPDFRARDGTGYKLKTRQWLVSGVADSTAQFHQTQETTP